MALAGLGLLICACCATFGLLGWDRVVERDHYMPLLELPLLSLAAVLDSHGPITARIHGHHELILYWVGGQVNIQRLVISSGFTLRHLLSFLRLLRLPRASNLLWLVLHWLLNPLLLHLLIFFIFFALLFELYLLFRLLLRLQFLDFLFFFERRLKVLTTSGLYWHRRL